MSMNLFPFRYWAFLMPIVLFSCKSQQPNPLSSLDRKAAPHDHFSWQRSWPDPDFDADGWRAQLQQIREQEIAQRNPCNTSSYVPDWKQQGPGNIGGRCNTLAVHPNDDLTVLAGFAGGGIFKTTDGGVNWRPVFDEHTDLAIGDITYDPGNPSVVYAGTGDPNMPSIVFNGDGVYRSIDGGEHWQHIGLSQAGVISKVVVHPTQPNTIWVAAQGNPYVRTPDRGIYRSTDGGVTWQNVLFVSNQAGACDLVMSPANPQILYASFWDRIRSNTESVVYGPNAGVWKSEDGGTTWAKLSGGLPTGIQCRTGLAVSPVNANKVYAVFIDTLFTTGSILKSTDGGATWSSNGMNPGQLEDACADFGWYFAKLRLHPTNDDEVYFLAILQWKKVGSGWQATGNGHADSHDLVITPSGRRYWANDGGVYYQAPNATMYTRSLNLPTTQFYRTTYNPNDYQNYWAGAQDNGIKSGNASTFNTWRNIFPADGFHCAFDPQDANRYWVEIQNGQIYYTEDNGANWAAQQAAFGTNDRVNWDAPFFMSKYGTQQFYAGTYKVLSSGDAVAWGGISPDLTDGIIYGPRFHTVSYVSESPILPNKLFAGTSDANVWRVDPGGQWTNITGSLPNRYVTSVRGSSVNAQRIFVTHSGYRSNESIPHVHRSDNNGQTWVNISGDLPQAPVNDLLAIPGHADSVLVAATDAGVYVTQNGGINWARLGGNMPFIPVFDLEENPANKEIVAATYARGIWTMSYDSILAQQTVEPAIVSLSGNLRTELNQPIGQTTVSGVPAPSSGNYLLENIPGCQPFTLKPRRNHDFLNGVTTYDLVLISKHILNIEPLNSPYKMIAADANRSGSVTTFDIVQLRKLLLGIYDTLPGNTSWRFIPTAFSFPNPINPFQTAFPEQIDLNLVATSIVDQHFTGVKTGDMNNSVDPSFQQAVNERNNGEWPLWTSVTENADGYSVLISTEKTDWSGLQFSLTFDAAQFEFTGMAPETQDISDDNFNFLKTGRGIISFAAERPQLTDSGEKGLFRLNFKVKNRTNQAPVLHLTEAPTPAAAYRHNGDKFQPVLFTTETGQVAVSCSPNPFGRAGTSLKIQSSTTFDECLLEVFDASGKRIFEQKTAINKGFNSLNIPASPFQSAGIYAYRIRHLQSNMILHDGKFIFRI
ncbi:MAG: T9SS type A sorting domain-containing protein [Saprospiraceae bacterium]|nr:T9SS type A sorting domain-containing protein [Saprospiraceae bacterium]